MPVSDVKRGIASRRRSIGSVSIEHATVFQLLPDAATLLELEPEELAGALMEHLNSLFHCDILELALELQSLEVRVRDSDHRLANTAISRPSRVTASCSLPNDS